MYKYDAKKLAGKCGEQLPLCIICFLSIKVAERGDRGGGGAIGAICPGSLMGP